MIDLQSFKLIYVRQEDGRKFLVKFTSKTTATIIDCENGKVKKCFSANILKRKFRPMKQLNKLNKGKMSLIHYGKGIERKPLVIKENINSREIINGFIKIAYATRRNESERLNLLTSIGLECSDESFYFCEEIRNGIKEENKTVPERKDIAKASSRLSNQERVYPSHQGQFYFDFTMECLYREKASNNKNNKKRAS